MEKKRIQVTGLWQWAARNEPGNVETVETEQLIQPLLHRVSWSVPNGLVQRNLMESASCGGTHCSHSDDRDTTSVRLAKE